ncbi:MAG: M4 family metallopeptidase [Saprospiraceae bacterium]|nr:M4 family metallopeptidase [Saprospiraceae bacterium]
MKQILFLTFVLIAVSLSAQLRRVDHTQDPKASENTRSNLPFSQNRASIPTADFNVKTVSGPSVEFLESGLKAGMYNELGVPLYIEGKLKVSGRRGTSPQNLAMEYLTTAGSVMKINQPEKEFSITSVETDELGMTHVRTRQEKDGVPVYGAEVLMHGRNNSFDFLNGTFYPSIEDLNTKPSLNPALAKQIVEKNLESISAYSDEVKMLFKGIKENSELVVYPYDGAFHLAYHVTKYKNIIDRWEYFIDAHTGEVINKYQSICKFHNHKKSEICDSNAEDLMDGKATSNSMDLLNISRLINTYQVGSKYYMIDGSRDIFNTSPANMPNDPDGVIWTIDAFNTSPQKDNFKYDHVTSTNNAWSSKTAVSSHYNGGQAYEYFRNVHGRKSINGQGGNIISLINVADDDGSSMGNAFWNGQAMFYGNGDGAFQPLARGLDVAGHEMSHGVIQSTANLEYQGESGALNESFADVFGVLIDRDDWKIGEDVVKTTAFPSGALRSMENPYNGAPANDFNKGWQPRIYSERYKGSEDNGGVHINSGIPNWAFFKFATAIGKDKAEKVYYRALTTYLTKSSKFTDCRIAVIKAATDLYTVTEVNAAKKAFDEVGILGEVTGNYQNDTQVNPGDEFILATGPDGTGMFIHDSSGKELAKITSKKVISKPSVTDDGAIIVYVASDKKIYFATIDWAKAEFKPDQVFDSRGLWHNAIISKDGSKIAAIYSDDKNTINVYDVASKGESDFELYNPTYTQGVSTGDVLQADAMEFDATGEWIMYDAENEIKSATAGAIEYWDIGFIKVWNNSTKTFSLGKVEKLYSSLPKNVSIGNPTFSKNSPYIIAFDYITNGTEFNLFGANIETGKSGVIFKNNALGYPNFSSKDNRLIFEEKSLTSFNLKTIGLKSTKIEPSSSSTSQVIPSKRWAIWFSNGKRVLSDTKDDQIQASWIKITGNPVSEKLVLTLSSELISSPKIMIHDVFGREVYSIHHSGNESSLSLEVQHLPAGLYTVSVISNHNLASEKFVKN